MDILFNQNCSKNTLLDPIIIGDSDGGGIDSNDSGIGEGGGSSNVTMMVVMVMVVVNVVAINIRI